MHEHLLIGSPGWEFDQLEPGPTFQDMLERSVAAIEELKSAGYSSLVDPCPMDMGRNVELMREVARRTGFNIICATGLYHGELGAAAHWRHRMMLERDTHKRLADVFVRELTDGVGDTRVRPGVLKTATGHVVTAYEEMIMAATALASLATGAPITTHTEGVHGGVQLETMCRAGVAADRIVVGHSCGSNDHSYHRSLLDRGAYLGFDRFGFQPANTDENRVDSLVRLIRAGFGERIVVSQDCVLCRRGGVDSRVPQRAERFLGFERTVVPMLRERGIAATEIDRLTIENPKRFFSGADAGRRPSG
jgi:phosphotriesterase-related protein